MPSTRSTEVMADSVIPPTETPEIPDKLYFRIGDVSKLAGVKAFVLRYWETEFPQLSPRKSGTGHRLYRRKDVETVLDIKRLLYEERFTIEGARNFLAAKGTITKPVVAKGKVKPKKSLAAPPVPSQGDLFAAPVAGMAPEALDGIRRELRSILDLLN